MVDNRFIEVLDGRIPITLFQPAHSVMQVGVGPIGKLTRVRCVGGPVRGDPALQILHSVYPIRKAFMQGRHVGHGIIFTEDCCLSRSRGCLIGSSDQGADSPSSSTNNQVDTRQTSRGGIPYASAPCSATDACEGSCVELNGSESRALLVSSPDQSISHTNIRSYDPRKPLGPTISHDIRAVAAARRSFERDRVAPGGGLSL